MDDLTGLVNFLIVTACVGLGLIAGFVGLVLAGVISALIWRRRRPTGLLGKVALWIFIKVPMLGSMLFLTLLPAFFLILLLTESSWSVNGIELGFLATIPLAFLGAFALWKTRFLTAKSEWDAITSGGLHLCRHRTTLDRADYCGVCPRRFPAACCDSCRVRLSRFVKPA